MRTWPFFDEEEIDAVADVLRSGRVNQWTGSLVESFQREFAGYVGVAHAVAVANGTVALELALRALGVGAGDEVIVPSRTFVALASSVVMVGAIPVFADVDGDSQLITVETVEAVRTAKTRAVIAVHLAGWPCDMLAFRKHCDEHRLFLVEDCAQAHGAFFHGSAVGSIGDIAVFSFCQDKIITTGGEGGMVVTANDTYHRRVWSLKDHGRNFRTGRQHASGPAFQWSTTTIGTNARMTEMQAALGKGALGKLDRYVEVRRRNAAVLCREFSKCDVVRVPVPPPYCGHSYYKFYAFVRPDRLASSWSRDRILHELQRAGVSTGVGSCPEIYLEEVFRGVRYPDGQMVNLQPRHRRPIAAQLGDTSLMFEVHPGMDENDMGRQAEVAASVFSAALR